ncbi:hypothetical protein [Micromonospora sp. LH3U1]|uniref:hypothetical protein n=1 Tax=Micromonospora sp. LH3U1 TaxID=3018339 RepID=UPI0023498BFA|nr:hypothetical protein [Micromonospora sp. LH3U1]WCN80929.1 hypothetical protein PCA76_29255 [Micromonospora sp. LH3U1]
MHSQALQASTLPRVGPTLRPLAAPWPALVVVADTNVLASRACNAVRRGHDEELFSGLAGNGRSNIYVSAHVPEELVEHLPAIAASNDVPASEASRVLWGEIMPAVPVVDLAIRDYLSPRVRPMLCTDRELPRRLRGDPDDIGTTALAELLAPAVILSSDSVFTRLGFANTDAATWVGLAYGLLRAAGFEARLGDAALLAELTARTVAAAGGATVRAIRSYPVPAIGLLAGAVVLAGRFGYLDPARWREGWHRFREAMEPLRDGLTVALEEHQAARGALRVIEPAGRPTVEQAAARYLARRRAALTPRELRDELSMSGFTASGAELRRGMLSHSAFSRRPGDRFELGRCSVSMLDCVEG